MKKILLLSFVLCLNTILQADNYKILQMNTSSVKIGNELLKVGDVFSDDSTIFWSDDKQAIKAMNQQTMEIKLFVAKSFKDNEANSIKDYFIKNSRLSTRGGPSFSDLTEELSDTLYLYDNIEVDSPIRIDSISSYIVSYELDGKKEWRSLMSTDKTFFFSRELFEKGRDHAVFSLSLYYRRKGLEDYLISDNIVIKLLPIILND